MAPSALRCYVAAVPLMLSCAQCRERVLEADEIDDDAECILRDHLMLAHPMTVQPATLEHLLLHYEVRSSS